MKSEKGQGLVEYAIIIVILAIVAIIILATCLWLPALIAALFAFWAPISAWGSGLVAGIMAGNPTAIFIAVVILIILLVIFGGRRRS